jgi:hypothetical protein
MKRHENICWHPDAKAFTDFCGVLRLRFAPLRMTLRS